MDRPPLVHRPAGLHGSESKPSLPGVPLLFSLVRSRPRTRSRSRARTRSRSRSRSRSRGSDSRPSPERSPPLPRPLPRPLPTFDHLPPRPLLERLRVSPSLPGSRASPKRRARSRRRSTVRQPPRLPLLLVGRDEAPCAHRSGDERSRCGSVDAAHARRLLARRGARRAARAALAFTLRARRPDRRADRSLRGALRLGAWHRDDVVRARRPLAHEGSLEALRARRHPERVRRDARLHARQHHRRRPHVRRSLHVPARQLAPVARTQLSDRRACRRACRGGSSSRRTARV